MKGDNISRRELLEGGWKWREGLIPLLLSGHAKRRVAERIEGELIIVPTMVRITRDNICSGRVKDGRLVNVKVRLDYKKDKWMFLVICPYSGVVKTLYINYKNAKKEREIRQRQGIKEGECCVEEDYAEAQAKDNGATMAEQRGDRENVGILPGNMERTPSLLRNIWNAIRRNPLFLPL